MCSITMVKRKSLKGAFLCILLIISSCSSYKSHHGDKWFGRDKLYHFTASGIIGAGSAAVADNNGMSEDDSVVIGVTVTIGVGATKEFYDAAFKKTYWSWKDLVWDMLGGALGSYAVAHSQ
ncbi:YfiM family protein [Candidatus Omnitrophota bacterium]